MPRRGLGQGLDVLIPTGEEEQAGLHEISVAAIEPNPHQPRTTFAAAELAELAQSIREHGIIQPLVVTQAGAGVYHLIAGERRWRAAKQAGLRTVPALVKEVAPQQMLELALVENVQRADLNPLEEAQAYHHLAQEFGLSQAAIARRVGKSRVAVTNVLRLLQASPAVQAALLEGEITEGHGRALLGLESHEEQDAALALVLQAGLTVRETEALVREWDANREPPEKEAPPPPEADPEIKALVDRLESALDTRVRLEKARKGGRVVISYFSDEEFRALYKKITGEEL